MKNTKTNGRGRGSKTAKTVNAKVTAKANARPVATVTAKETKSPAPVTAKSGRVRDPRIPAPGTMLKREYKGKEHAVKVLADGFDYKGEKYRSLSAIAVKIAGCSWNGMVFFGLGSKRQTAA